MHFNRTQNAARNIFFGLALKLYQIIVPFIMRTIMIYYMGMQYTGLNSLFTSVLQVLNLAELGVGSAMVYSMYQPIIDNDREKLKSLMRLYRTYYRIIGLIIAIAGGILTPFIPDLIHGTIPRGMNVYILYLLNLSATVFSYWLFAYKNSLLDAHQRTDIVSKITLITNTLQYSLQAWTIISLHNYYAYVIMTLFGQLLNNVIIAIFANKMYPDLHPGEPLDKASVREINNRIRDLFTARVGFIIVGPVDTVFISSFLGLTMLARYQNYFYILTAVSGIINVIFASVTAGIGNSLIVESEEKNVKDLTKFTFIISWIAGVSSCCLLNLYQPFMELWVGEKNLLDFGVVICLTIYLYVIEINQLLNTYKDAGGVWHKDRFRPLVGDVVIVLLDWILIKSWGIYGVMLSTVFSMVAVTMPWLLYNLFTTMFNKKHLETYLQKLLTYVVVTILVWLVSYIISSFINNSLLIKIPLRLIACLIVSNLIYFLAYKNKNEFFDVLSLINKLTGDRVKLISKLLNNRN